MTTGYLGDSGIVLNGPADAAGVLWRWSGDDPWTPSPEPREESGSRVGDHGDWDATEFYAARSYTISGYAEAPTHAALHAAKDRLSAACGLRPFDFRILEPGLDRTASFRRSGQPLWSEQASLIRANFSVGLKARDPRIYSTALHTATTGFPSSSGGLTLPLTVPLTIPATVTSGLLSLSNAGTEVAWPTFRIDGPVTNPGVVDMATGKTWRLKLSLAAGEWVTVDSSSHQVLSMGDVNGSRRSAWSGDWFGLAPGSNSLRFVGEFAGPGAQLSASFRDVWI